MREPRRVVQGLSKDVENYQDFIRPICEIAWDFPWVDAALIHLIRCPESRECAAMFN